MKSNLDNKNLLGTSPISEVFVKYAIPSVIALLFFGVQNIIDGIIVGKHLSSDALGGVNIILPFYSILIVISFVIGVGSLTIVSIGAGENNINKSQDAISTGFWALLVTASVITVILFFYAKDFALLLGANKELLPFALSYLNGLFPFIIPITLGFYSGSILRATGHPNFSMTSMLITTLINLILSPVFVIFLKLGVMGASLATGISFTIGLIISGYISFNPKQKYAMYKGKFRQNLLGKIIYNGSSEGVSELGTAITVLIINYTVVKFSGSDGVAAFTAINYVNLIGVLIFIGISEGLVPVLSYNFGAKNYNRVKAILRFAVKINIIIGLLFLTIVQVWGSSILQLFFESSNSKVIRIATLGLSIYSFVFLVNGLNILATSFFTSLEDARTSIIISVLRGILFVILGVTVLSKFLGINGVWIALPLAEVLTLIFSVYFLVYKNKQLSAIEI
ncbi:MATE family efflux transporter [Zhouia spongiae]|uniref:Multidrug export protein MepA n=1 Tax=Zhouia spongiae TaxID=2202721 RepID=A0ABY3YRH1_9FLAO|nr:MATE family efflux transporter [Zhouia spongiae]UNZ00355.1 MATE family efflux transporter [Zhouia spongiae]